MINALHGPNAMQLELTCDLMKKYPALAVSPIKSYSSSDMELFPLRNKPPLEEGEENKIVKVLKERRTRNKKEREYLVRYRNPTQGDEWILEKDIANAYKILRRFRNEIKPKEYKKLSIIVLETNKFYWRGRTVDDTLTNYIRLWYNLFWS
ncbi:hypothetical protein O181_111394 [Austropuccinia psidii MF-1]|uniref:Chromo domain-containing protein n=1 Tax=Austropuccinia psidii MF-1 TaxID=1389203 RepID=A0A9Q3K011_9BASI|nr:hypothetical protein [Austropuccinia psidii MF-1]